MGKLYQSHSYRTKLAATSTEQIINNYPAKSRGISPVLILSRRGRRPSWLNQGIFRKIEQDNCFIIQQIPIDYHFQNEKNYGSMIKTLKESNT